MESRVFLGINDVGGHLWGLHEGLARNGIMSDVYYYEKTYLNYPCDYLIEKKSKHKVINELSGLSDLLGYTRLYDIFHFNFAKSFIRGMLDLPLIKSRGKQIFVTFNGSNTRPPNWCLKNFEFSQYGRNGKAFRALPPNDDSFFKRIRSWDKRATAIFCLNPDLCRHTKKGIFLPYIKPLTEKVVLDKKPKKKGKIVIAHAPTNRQVKGTDAFLEAVEKVNDKYNCIEVKLIENMSNEKALFEIAQCDLLFDQLYVGWYGGVAVESMSMGVPAISYIRTSDFEFVSDDYSRELPILRTSETTLVEDLIRFIFEVDLCKTAEESREFIKKYHSPEAVGRIVGTRYGLI